ncbi:MAG TPA: hypothetical protein PKW21_14930 [Rhabdaerophilum sp.]|nr:hypothetical protein [Rhabdaerophilum sp.]
MLEMLSGKNAIFLLVAVAGFWFTVRFVVAPRRGTPGLGALFRRETALPKIGLGREAIASLLADTRQFAIGEPGIRGLLLGGLYAAKEAEPSSPVVLVALADNPQTYRGDSWLDRWGYLKRGHEVLSRDEAEENGVVCQQLTLRGAPPVEFHFLKLPDLSSSVALDEALEEGLTVIDDPAGLAAKFRQATLARIESRA